MTKQKKLVPIMDVSVVCEDCGRKIPKERIKALPNTTLCVKCAAESESNGGTDKIVPLIDYDPQELFDATSPDD